MITLPKIKNSRPLVLAIVVLISLISSTFVYLKNTGSSSASLNRIKKSLVQTKIESIRVEVAYDLDLGFLDIYLSGKDSKVSLMEFVFITKGEAKLNSLERADLFADYLKTSSKDSFRVASTGGPEAKEVTLNDKVLFARIKIDNLESSDSVVLDLQNSQAVTKEDKLIKLVY